MGLRPRAFVLLAGAIAALMIVPAHAQRLSGKALVDALRRGGYVLVMRHASAPRETPDEKTARPDNVKRERQLDEAGRAGATAMGAALRQLKIPIGDVLASPTYRTLETARLAGFDSPESHPELGDRGRSMQGVTDVEGKWLQQKASERPAGNTLIVTHMPNIARAFAGAAADVNDGETLIFKPDGKGGTELVARVRIEEWPTLEP